MRGKKISVIFFFMTKVFFTIWRYGMLTLKVSFMLECQTIRTLVMYIVPRLPWKSQQIT